MNYSREENEMTVIILVRPFRIPRFFGKTGTQSSKCMSEEKNSMHRVSKTNSTDCVLVDNLKARLVPSPVSSVSQRLLLLICL